MAMNLQSWLNAKCTDILYFFLLVVLKTIDIDNSKHYNLTIKCNTRNSIIVANRIHYNKIFNQQFLKNILSVFCKYRYQISEMSFNEYLRRIFHLNIIFTINTGRVKF